MEQRIIIDRLRASCISSYVSHFVIRWQLMNCSNFIKYIDRNLILLYSISLYFKYAQQVY